MIEFLNVLAAAVAALILGLCVHSAYVHSKNKGDIKPMPWDHKEEKKQNEQNKNAE